MGRRQGQLIAEQFQLKSVPGKWHVEILSTFTDTLILRRKKVEFCELPKAQKIKNCLNL